MKLLIPVLLTLVLSLASCSSTISDHPTSRPSFKPPVGNKAYSNSTGNYRGWDYLANRLKKDGFTDEMLIHVFSDERMPLHEEIPFAVAPREHEAMYAGFTTKKNIARGFRCLREHSSAFAREERAYGVQRYVVASILLVETLCGDNTGKSQIFNKLARLASLSEPENVEWNFERLRQEDPSVTLAQVRERAAYLDQTFYPEVVSLITLASRENMDVLSIYGSSAGAFGVPQFLPSTYLKYAIDSNKDGKADIHEIDDAIFSVGHFLSSEGWKASSPLSANREVIWKYNRSDPYIDTVLKVAILLEKMAKAQKPGNPAH